MKRTYHVQHNKNGTFSYVICSGDGAQIDFRLEFAFRETAEQAAVAKIAELERQDAAIQKLW